MIALTYLRRRPATPVAIALAMTAAVALGSARCDDRPSMPTPDVVRVGSGFMLVWQVPRGDHYEILAARAGATSHTLLTTDEPVARVQLGGSGDHMIVLVWRRPDGDDDGRVRVFTIPIDRDGRPRRDPQPQYIAGDGVCTGIATVGDRYVTGSVLGASRFGDGAVFADTYDRDGNLVGHVGIAFPESSCAIAGNGERVAIAFGKIDPIRLSVRDPATGRWTATAALDDAGFPTRMVAYHDGWALLYIAIGAHHGPAVAIFDGRGALRTIERLPHDVEPSAIDLAVNARGLFVSWIDGRTAHFVPVGGEGRPRTKSVDRAASCARAVGYEDRCAMFALDRDDLGMSIVEIPRCP